MSNKMGVKVILVLLLNVWWAEAWNFGGTDKISFGEISLENHGYLPAITLEHKGDESSFEGWPKSSLPTWGHTSLTDTSIEIPKEHHDKFIPVIKEVGVPVVEEVPIKVPHLSVETVAQPYPVLQPVVQRVPYEVIKHVLKHKSVKVPTKVEKIEIEKVEKPVPFKVERIQQEIITKHVPFKVPVYRTIHHYSKGH